MTPCRVLVVELLAAEIEMLSMISRFGFKVYELTKTTAIFGAICIDVAGRIGYGEQSGV